MWGGTTTNSVGDADCIFEGEAGNEQVGWWMASAGDLDGDGLADVTMGVHTNDDGASNAGKAYLVLGAGPGSGGVFNLGDADDHFIGENCDGDAGESLSSAGDIDGDGLLDVVIGAPGNDDGGDAAGKVYVMLGGNLGSTAGLPLSGADDKLIGGASLMSTGSVLASASDLDGDGDGRSDVLVGAHANNDYANRAGKAYLLLSGL